MSLDHDEKELELTALGLLAELRWETADASAETFPGSFLGREHPGQVVLEQQLSNALAQLNPDLPGEALGEALDRLTRSRPPGNPVRVNQEVYRLLKDGARVEVEGSDGTVETVTVRYIEWNDPSANDFLAVRQFKVTGDLYTTVSDMVGFVNGIPLVFVEFKAPHIDIRHAHDGNLTHYRDQVPQVVWFNALTILSNGGDTRVGSFSASWDHFGEWKRISDEEEPPSTSIETALRGLCEPARLLDVVENFTLFQEVPGGLIKILAKNHQYLGVNAALDRLADIEGNQGRLGVFWHTQGSGKSFSMIFFTQKALRRLGGTYTFVVVTDRADLDDQIYKNFVSTGAVTEEGAQAGSGEHLKRLLTEDHRYVFTLIHKFRTDTGETHPTLSVRSDVIVIVDEAHRTQYDTLALNMRNALTNAAFLAFTGTPLMAGEQRTREVFGDYVSIYNFRQSIEDRATVPLYYENRSPEVVLVGDRLNEKMEAILESADLDEDQERRLAREFAQEYHLITDDDRLDTVAADLVDHFVNRGHQGKAMVVSIDKATAVKMYDRVNVEWKRALDTLRDEIAAASGEHREALEDRLAWLTTIDMAVVVSASQNEIPDLAKQRVDITPHRKRMVAEQLDVKFKDADDELRIVFVCAMWLTGFDAPATSTIYLDKPMRNHTLMQTIVRANRVAQGKTAGEIIDYIGVFRNLQQALAIYGSGSGGGVEPGDLPVAPKEEQAETLRQMLDELAGFVSRCGVDLTDGLGVTGFNWVAWLSSATEALLVDDETRRGFLHRADAAARQWKAVKPHQAATEAQPEITVIVRLAQRIRAIVGTPDISGVMSSVEQLLEESVGAEPFVIDPDQVRRIDLTQIDFESLAGLFASGKRNTAAQQLRTSLEKQIDRLARLNPTRIDYAAKLQEVIDRYNAGSLTIEVLFDELKELTQSLNDEQERHVREELTEEELTIFDLLTKPGPDLTAAEEARVKKVVRELLAKLKWELLVLDWKKRQQTRAAVEVTIAGQLDAGLPAIYDRRIYQEKCARIFQHVFESYQGAGKSIYEEAA